MVVNWFSKHFVAKDTADGDGGTKEDVIDDRVIQFNESGGISSSVKNIIKHSTPKDFGVSNGKSLPEYMW